MKDVMKIRTELLNKKTLKTSIENEAVREKRKPTNLEIVMLNELQKEIELLEKEKRVLNEIYADKELEELRDYLSSGKTETRGYTGFGTYETIKPKN